MVPEKSRALKIKDFWYWNLTWKIESWNLLLLFSIFRTMFFHPVKGRVGCIEGYHNFVKFNVPSYYRASRRKVDTGLLWKNIWRAKFQIEGFIFWLDGCVGEILTVDDLSWICIVCIRWKNSISPFISLYGGKRALSLVFCFFAYWSFYVQGQG